VFEQAPSRSGGSYGLVGQGDDLEKDSPAGPAGVVFTDESGQATDLVADGPGVDAAVKALTIRISERLAIPRTRRVSAASRGPGMLKSEPYRGRSDDIDLDKTIDVLTEKPVPEDADIIVREPVRPRRAVLLAVDVSGSMRGERVKTAAAAVGALAGELAEDNVGVLAFWSDAAWLLRPGHQRPALSLVDDLLRLPAKGLTNLAFPLELAGRELGRVPEEDARVVLLSDCVHNAGPDPRELATGIPRLDALIDVTGENDIELGRELAHYGHGRAYIIRDHRDVAPALMDAFAR
jgi:Mg-chelatase subunit ChlD